MKKSNKSLTISERLIVSLCVMFFIIGCSQDYESIHTVSIHDTISRENNNSETASNDNEEDDQSKQSIITKTITFIEETSCYCGVFYSLYTDYGKSELTTDIIPLDSTADIMIDGKFVTDTSGDMIRFIVRFYEDGTLLSENVQKGITLTDCTTDITMITTVPDQCSGIAITVQAKYDSKKGGSRDDVVKFLDLCVTEVINDCIEESFTDDVTSDVINDDITSDTEFEVLTFVSMREVDKKDDVSDDVDIELEATFDDIADLYENVDELYDVTNDETSDESSCYEILLNEVTLTELRTDYSKCHIEMSDYIKVVDQELSLEMSFYSDSSGDMVRAVVECYDEQYALLESKTLTGARSSAGEWVTNVRNAALSDGVAYIKICAEAKYESKKGGDKNDVVVCRINLIEN